MHFAVNQKLFLDYINGAEVSGILGSVTSIVNVESVNTHDYMNQ